MSNTSTDPGFDQNDVLGFKPEQVAADITKLVGNIVATLKRMNGSRSISEQELRNMERCASAIKNGALILKAAHETKIALARAKYWGRV